MLSVLSSATNYRGVIIVNGMGSMRKRIAKYTCLMIEKIVNDNITSLGDIWTRATVFVG